MVVVNAIHYGISRKKAVQVQPEKVEPEKAEKPEKAEGKKKATKE